MLNKIKSRLFKSFRSIIIICFLVLDIRKKITSLQKDSSPVLISEKDR